MFIIDKINLVILFVVIPAYWFAMDYLDDLDEFISNVVGKRV